MKFKLLSTLMGQATDVNETLVDEKFDQQHHMELYGECMVASEGLKTIVMEATFQADVLLSESDLDESAENFDELFSEALKDALLGPKGAVKSIIDLIVKSFQGIAGFISNLLKRIFSNNAKAYNDLVAKVKTLAPVVEGLKEDAVTDKNSIKIAGTPAYYETLAGAIGGFWKKEAYQGLKITDNLTVDVFFNTNVVDFTNALKGEDGTGSMNSSTFGSTLDAIKAYSNKTGIGQGAQQLDVSLQYALNSLAELQSNSAIVADWVPTEAKNVQGTFIKNIFEKGDKKTINGAEYYAFIKKEIAAVIEVLKGDSQMEQIKKALMEGEKFFTELSTKYKKLADDLNSALKDGTKQEKKDNKGSEEDKPETPLKDVLGRFNEVTKVSHWFTTIMLKMYNISDTVVSRSIVEITGLLNAVEKINKKAEKTEEAAE